jgi:hypothetical protein
VGESFEVVQFIEPDFVPGVPYPGPEETVLGEFNTEADAVECGRKAWISYRERELSQVAWWIVRVPGESLARWIAESRNASERVLDLRTQQFVDL